ncbi:MAG: 3-isopropylmalate dehydratase small subunit, partial [Ilumatobacteraceae bacterium]
MNPITTVTGIAVPVPRANIDTDVLIRIDRLVEHPPDELGEYLFESWRTAPDGHSDPTFPLNKPKYQGAVVLV